MESKQTIGPIFLENFRGKMENWRRTDKLTHLYVEFGSPTKKFNKIDFIHFKGK